MTNVVPFRAVVYNQSKIKDLSKVVCPPYDIISPERQKQLHERSPYNLIHLEFGLDIRGEDKYERAAAGMERWLAESVIVKDADPAVYFYSQEYAIKGERKIRWGFLALLKLDEGTASVYGHEHTHLEPKEDRLRLIKKVGANLSPIFVVFADKKKLIRQTLLPLSKQAEPFIDIIDDERVRHKVWRFDDRELLSKVSQKMKQESIFIADGHHRYEVACAYRDEMRRKHPDYSGDEGFNHILAYFTNIDAAGITVLPIHRLLAWGRVPDMPALVNQLREYFYVEELKDRVKFFFLLQKAGRQEHALGMCHGDTFWLLRLKNVRVLNKLMPDKPAEYRSIDVSILNAIILEKILGLDTTDKSKLTFTADTDALLEEVRQDPTRMAFVLNPTRIEQIMQVALRGEKMPPKSTYFYPKVLSGLVVNKHE